VQFCGVIPVLQTPFDETEGLDCESLDRQVAFAVEAGADGLAYPGFASDWWRLSESEIEMAAETILVAAKNRIPVVFNITAQSTSLAVQAARRFTAMGCQGLMCLPPFIAGATSAEIRRHLAAVLDASDLPFMLQWSPSLAGGGIEWSDLATIEQRFPHCNAIKVDFAPPGPTVSRLMNQFGERFTYLIGYAGLGLPEAMQRGARGLMGGCGHLRQDISVFRSLEADRPEAETQFRKLERLLNFEMQTIHTSIATHKWLLTQQGVITRETVREPGSGLTPEQVEQLKELRKELS
jgi:4-hydroxy-tetrahydrodipicolinate synthase